jgi:hypothetical protein
MGPIGPQGPVGAPGQQGETGATGSTGPQGPQGLTGAQGPQGPIGPIGAQGVPGEQGETGATGAIGPQGAAGPVGATGPQGLTGAQGPQGPAGPQGPTGPQGATGPQGPSGVSSGSSFPPSNTGSVFYNTTLGGLYLYNGTSWQKITVDTSGGRIQDNFLNYSLISQNGYSTLPLHIKTNIRNTMTLQYRFEVEGYSLLASRSINADASGYMYSSNGLINTNVNNYVAGGPVLSQYVSTDGYVVLKLTSPYDFHTTWFTVSAHIGYGSLDVDATVVSSATNL